MRNSSSLVRAGWILAFFVGSIVVASMAGWLTGFPLTGILVKALLLGAAVFGLLWLSWRLLTIFLWRVGRRLAFSYFLMGILPIPMVTLFALAILYLLGGYFLGHLYRDASFNLQTKVSEVATTRLAEIAKGSTDRSSKRQDDVLLAYYRNGKKIGGAEKLPTIWPGWLKEAQSSTEPSNNREPLVSYISIAKGPPTVAATSQRGAWSVLAVFDGSVEDELARKSDVWVLLERATDREENLIRINLGERDYFFRKIRSKPDELSRKRFFGLESDTGDTPRLHWWEKPCIWWGELAPPLRRLNDGKVVSPYISATLNGAPTTIYRHLLAASGEVDTAVWASLIGTAGVLLSIYSVAIAMAFYMIFTLSGAVNQLSRATDAVRAGDFSTRIPVRRHDQIGELHDSFNDMAAGLERSVAAIAQKEILENELQIARDLQQSLLPSDIPSSDAVEFATLFEPSSAIGGDYFDIMRLDEDRLLVVIADVSGHGLPTGLRMAMLKAALVILVQDGTGPVEIFKRLSTMVRAEQERRFFVTCTLAIIDFRDNSLELTNAGHPPTYLVRQGNVRELAPKGNPLGALGENYGQMTVDLEGGDVVVWLSDGLIEAIDSEGDPFGYERLQEALAGPSNTATEVIKRLLLAEETFTGGRVNEDDKTLVAMRYSIPPAATSTPSTE